MTSVQLAVTDQTEVYFWQNSKLVDVILNELVLVIFHVQEDEHCTVKIF